MNESKLRFKDDDGSEFPDWEEKSVGDITIELKEYEQLNSGYPLMTSSRIGLMMQEDFRSKSSTEDDTAIFSVVPRGVATYRHMSDDNIFHFNINNLVDKGLVSKEYPVFNTVNGNSLYLLVEYLNSSKKFLNFCKAQKKGGTRTRLYFKVLKEFKFNMPSLPEQQKIADFLSTIDTVIEKQKTTVEAWEERKKGVMEKLFCQKIRFKTDEKSEFPEWREKQFGEIISEFKEKTEIENEDTLLSCAINGIFLNSELFGHQRGQSNIGYLKIKKGTLVLSTQNLHLGNANVNMRFEHGIISPAYKTYNIVGCSVEYMNQWIKWDTTKRFFYNATTVGASGCRRNVDWNLLYSQKIDVPCPEEQEKIVECLSALDDVVEKQKETLCAWENLKDGLLQQVFI